MNRQETQIDTPHFLAKDNKHTTDPLAFLAENSNLCRLKFLKRDPIHKSPENDKVQYQKQITALMYYKVSLAFDRDLLDK